MIVLNVNFKLSKEFSFFSSLLTYMLLETKEAETILYNEIHRVFKPTTSQWRSRILHTHFRDLSLQL